MSRVERAERAAEQPRVRQPVSAVVRAGERVLVQRDLAPPGTPSVVVKIENIYAYILTGPGVSTIRPAGGTNCRCALNFSPLLAVRRGACLDMASRRVGAVR